MVDINRALFAPALVLSDGDRLAASGQQGQIDELTVIEVEGTGPEPEQVPVARRVFLLRLLDAKVIAAGSSNARGEYAFRHLMPTLHVPISIDSTGQYEAVAAGPVMPKGVR